MTRRRVRTVLSLALAIVILAAYSCLPVAALKVGGSETQRGAESSVAGYRYKDEVVYANLSDDGSVRGVFVVNGFEISQTGTLADYGNYSDVTNLTTTREIVHDRNGISVEVEPGQFYYQGTLEEGELPWLFSISYLLNGTQIHASELAGRSGQLEIRLKTQKSPHRDEVFYDNYMLQITLMLDAEKSRNIKSERATIANAGKNKTIAHTVMPGKDADIVISANVQDFTMSGFEIVAMPFSIPMELPDIDNMTEDMVSLVDAIDSLNIGVGEFSSGMEELNDGVAQLADGSALFAGGLSKLSGNSEQLTGGSAQIQAGIAQIVNGLGSDGESENKLDGFGALPISLRQLAQGFQQLAKGLVQLKDGYSMMLSNLDASILSIPDGTASEADISSLYGVVTDPGQQAILVQLIESYVAAQTVKGTYITADPLTGMSIQSGMKAIGTSLDSMVHGDGIEKNPGINGMVIALNTMADKIEDAMNENDVTGQLQLLVKGLTSLAEQYGQFHSGLVEYTNGVEQVATSYSNLHRGLIDIKKGTNELSKGTQDLYEGTTVLSNEVTNLPDTIQVEIDKLMEDYDKSDFEPVSFVSAQNGKVELVQFVFMTDGVEIAKEEASVQVVTRQETLWNKLMAVWDRFIALFE